MNNEEIKFDINEDILYQIAMIIYDRHNSNIASINEHLGEMYSYKDLEDAKRYELEDEKHLLELAVKQLQEENQQLKEQLKQRDEVVESLKTRIKTIKRRRKLQTQKIKKYKKLVTDRDTSLTRKNKLIDKAINFIKEHAFIDESMPNCNALSQKNAKELKSILNKYKGVDD